MVGKNVLLIADEKGKKELRKILQNLKKVKLPPEKEKEIKRIEMALIEGENLFRPLTE